MFKKILIATDGSKPSEHAARVGVDLAAAIGGTVKAVYVVDKGRILENVDISGIELSKDVLDGARLGLQKEGRIATEYIEKLARASGVKIQTKVDIGSPAEAILKSADENQIDAIVIGSKGRTGLSKVLLGSVAEKVVRNSKIPVVVVPEA
ncbi:MAG: universal stress protein [Methanotrichaceae archaeon]|nr:universal stress protein [Methanotrichaceae archaeon]